MTDFAAAKERPGENSKSELTNEKRRGWSTSSAAPIPTASLATAEFGLL
ncbi:MAG: hypothetical protein RL258_1330 [Pseudomonadota bacterium]